MAHAEDKRIDELPLKAVPDAADFTVLEDADTLTYYKTSIQNIVDAAAPEWGNITGTLSSQTDLQGALDDINAELDDVVYVTTPQTITGLKTIPSFLMPDSSSQLWLVTLNTDGSFQTTAYVPEDTPLDAFLSEDGLSYFITEDSNNYFAQEA